MGASPNECQRLLGRRDIGPKSHRCVKTSEAMPAGTLYARITPGSSSERLSALNSEDTCDATLLQNGK